MGVTVAIVGAGGMAREHARAFAATPGTTVAGIFSRTRAKAESLARDLGIPEVCDSIPQLFERTKADLLVIAVSEGAAKEAALAAFDYPWTVLLEKPPGVDYDAALAIRDAAARQKRRVLVALNRRFLSSTRAALDDLADRRGTRFISVQDQQDLARDPGPQHTPEVRANWHFANSIHVIDYLRAFGRGRIERVTRSIPWDRENPATVVATIEFESGDKGLYQGIWNGPGPWAVQVTTPEMRWELRPLETASFQPLGKRVLEAIPPHPRDQQFKPGFLLQAQNAVSSAKGLPSASIQIDDAIETMALIRDIFRAA